MFGEVDNDAMFGGNGNDISLDGGEGEDSIRGNSGNDNLTGGFGNDTLRGDLGDDFLFGNEGDDNLFGGFGADALYGAAGADTMLTAADLATDTFTYLDASEGGDLIRGFEVDFEVIYLNFILQEDIDAAHFVGSAAEMTDTGPYIIYAGNENLSVDLDGTDGGGAAFLARMIGAPALTFGNFSFGSAA